MDNRKISAQPSDSTRGVVVPFRPDDVTERGAALPRSSRSPIELRIQSDDVFLSGSFHRWQANAASGPDLDMVSVNLAIDATSPDRLSAHAREHHLFSFTSKKLHKLGDNVFSAEGLMTTDAGEQPCDVLVEIPDGHTAFVALAFVVKKEFLGEGWQEITGAAGMGGIDAERSLDARTGLRGMELAAA
jgi:hypothetical protein